ncbi:MAG: PAS domain S-box protein [Melioribacteraceae bacterium]|jgi:PAS domain S-box-containing protein|nr:PAS domain S-box protein [Melioribacteraceae bacterium]
MEDRENKTRLALLSILEDQKRVEDALRAIVKTFSHETGKDLFEKVSAHIAKTLQVDYVFVGELGGNNEKVKVVGGFGKGEFLTPFEYDLKDTPCEKVVGRSTCVHSSGVQQLFPKDILLVQLGIEGYLGTPLFSKNNQPIGIIVVLNEKAIPNSDLTEAIFNVFSDKVVAEIERSNSENNLKQSEYLLNKTQEIANVGSWEIELKSNILTWTDETFRIFGYKPQEFTVTYDAFLARVHADDREELSTLYTDSVKNKMPYDITHRVNRSDGEIRLVREKCIHILNECGEVIKSIGMVQDITESIESEEKIIQSEIKYKTIVDNSLTSIYTFNNKKEFTDANLAGIQLLGYSKKELLKLSMPDVDANTEAVLPAHENLLSGDNLVNFEHQLIRKNGEIITVLNNSISLKDEVGNVIGMQSFLLDITVRKQAEELLKESEKKFRSVWENSTDGMRITNEKGIAILVNDAYCKLMKKSQAEIEGNPMSVIYQEDRQADILNKHQKRFRAREIPEFLETEITLYNGTKLFLELSNTFLEIENQPTLSLSIFRDITERKLTELELIESKEKAEESEKLKTEFLAQISHEIRTPLNIIVNNSSLLREELYNKVDADFHGCFDSLDIASKRIIRTIDLILNMSAIQTGSFELWNMEIDLITQIIQPIIVDHKILAENKGLSFSFHSKVNDSKLFSDEYCITHIVSNLIDNAIKFTAKGQVKVSLYRNSNAKLTLEVLDSGIGMTDDFQNVLFEPFLQEEQGYGRKFDGNGLGLALVKKYCELINADISVESKKNIGTKFSLIFNSEVI